MIDRILSSIGDVATAKFVYSSFGFFARRRSKILPGKWFVEAFEAIGISENTVRQTLHRMVNSGELCSSRVGREKFYSAPVSTWATIDAGARKLKRPAARNWNGQWSCVYFTFANEHRKLRDRLRMLLEKSGFAALGPGMMVHPRDFDDQMLHVLGQPEFVGSVLAMRGKPVLEKSNRPSRGLVDQLYDLVGINGTYRDYVSKFRPLLGRIENLSERDAFGLRFIVVFEYLEAAWLDPDLPRELLPKSWAGERANKLVTELNRYLTPRAMAFADRILRSLTTEWPYRTPMRVTDERKVPQ